MVKYKFAKRVIASSEVATLFEYSSIRSLMNRKLRKGKIDAFLIERSINRLVYVEINAPIIATLHPNTDYNIHTAGIQRMQSYKRSRIIENTLIGGQHLTYHFFHLIIVFTIIDAKDPFNATGLLVTIVSHHSTA